MLYERWQSIVESNAKNTAIFDPQAGRHWTFGELAWAAAEAPLDDRPVQFPRKHDVSFLIHVLTAWREGTPVLALEKDQATPELPAIDSSTAHLKLTSGTTGQPQLIAFTAAQLAADAENIISTMSLDPSTPNLAAISLSHSYGFSNLVTPLLLHGIPVILSPTPLPETVRNAADGHDRIVLPAVPAMWRAWHSAGAIPPNVRTAISAGAPLALELEQAVFDSCGLKIHNFCGSSECGGIAYDRSERPRTDATVIGEAMDNVRLSIDEDGCLVVESAAVGNGYINSVDPRLSNRRFVTSDLAELKEGHLRITGRISDVINIAGRKLSPETVENVVRSLDGVRDCVSFGVPSRDNSRCDEVAIAVELDPGADPVGIKQQTSQHLATWQWPRHWWTVEHVVTNARGKISRREWRDRFLKNQTATGTFNR